MRICEIFHSIQGEGVDAGLPTVFVRTVGCNLRCNWCDTRYALDGGSEWELDGILRRVRSYRCRRVCLTGGEPLIQRDALELVRRLLDSGYEVSVETNGSLSITGLLMGNRGGSLRISMDVKCPSSGMHRTTRLEALGDLRPVDQVKLVIRDRRDFLYARRVLRSHPTAAAVVLQPVWGARADRIVGWVLEEGLEARVMIQMHKVIWGARARRR
ncbi:MAG: 7-carboxy-7-deazaguanine synthase QueE [Thermoplasmatota archaeon]